MHRLRDCQCGAAPLYKPGTERVKGRIGRPKVARGAERVECPACGNRTAERCGRQALAEEWNSAGWCGQAELPEACEPYGEAWSREMLRKRKPELVACYRHVCQEKEALRSAVRRLRARLNRTELEEVVERLRQCGTLKRRPAGAVCAEGVLTETGKAVEG